MGSIVIERVIIPTPTPEALAWMTVLYMATGATLAVLDLVRYQGSVSGEFSAEIAEMWVMRPLLSAFLWPFIAAEGLYDFGNKEVDE